MASGVQINPSVCHGKPVIPGTRVLVSTVLGALAGGDAPSAVVEDYGITHEQLTAALAFAAELADAPSLACDGAA